MIDGYWLLPVVSLQQARQRQRVQEGSSAHGWECMTAWSGRIKPVRHTQAMQELPVADPERTYGVVEMTRWRKHAGNGRATYTLNESNSNRSIAQVNDNLQ
jgi:hypothetical protein